MDWMLALIGVIGTLVGAYFTAQWAAKSERDKIREELKLEYSVERAITHLLTEQGWPLRTFSIIKYHIRGFDDDKLREHLVRAGAIAFEDQDNIEVWGLLELNKERLTKKAAE